MLIIMITDTRVGSTAFGNALANGTDSIFHGEVLSPDAYNNSDTGLPDTIKKLTILESLDDAALYASLDEYFINLSRDRAVNIIDLKYHDLFILPSHPYQNTSPPSLLRYLISRNFHIIHLNRVNKLTATLSAVIASRSKVHHLLIDSPSPTVDINFEGIALYDVVKATYDRIESHDQFRRWLSQGLLVLDVEYEAIYTSGDAVLSLINFLRQCWGCNGIEFNMKHRRITSYVRPSPDFMLNLHRILEGTDLEESYKDAVIWYSGSNE